MAIRASVAALTALTFASLSEPALATTVIAPWIGGGTLTMNYTFTAGPSTSVFAVQSVAVTNDDSTSGYYGMFPVHTIFTGFLPLVAPACTHTVCLYDFGVLNAGEAAGYNPFPVWAWFGSEQSFGTDAPSGATLGVFNVIFYVYGTSGGFLADAAGSFSLRLADGTTTGLDFISLGAAGPDPLSVPGPDVGEGIPGGLLTLALLWWFLRREYVLHVRVDLTRRLLDRLRLA